jgi:IclR family pca regulon transcriptional regulator
MHAKPDAIEVKGTDGDDFAGGGADKSPEMRDFVSSLARGLGVIRSFDMQNPEMTLTQVAKRTGLTRAGARRFLLTLTELGYVKKDQRLFSLTPKILELGYAFMASAPLSLSARPIVEWVTEQTSESCNMGVLDRDDMVNVAHTGPRGIVMVNVHVGARIPAAYTAVGRAILAFIPDADLEAYMARLQLKPLTSFSLTSKTALRAELMRVRSQGYAFVDRELHEGMRTLGVPVFNIAGDVAAAVNITNHAVTVPKEKIIKDCLPALQQAAADLQKLLTV